MLFEYLSKWIIIIVFAIFTGAVGDFGNLFITHQNMYLVIFIGTVSLTLC